MSNVRIKTVEGTKSERNYLPINFQIDFLLNSLVKKPDQKDTLYKITKAGFTKALESARGQLSLNLDLLLVGQEEIPNKEKGKKKSVDFFDAIK
jgi:hypothetical protein